MSTTPIDWKAISGLEGQAFKEALFAVFQESSYAIQGAEAFDPDVLSVVPRVADLMDGRQGAEPFREMFSAFARSVGLWNYIDREYCDSRDAVAAEVASVPQLGVVLHREQMAALNVLLSGQNLVLSAPTSFGKSILVDALLAAGSYNRVAIVLPTIALLDEFRRRLVTRFRGQFDVIMHHSEVPTRERVIFLGTQERLIKRDDLGVLDLVVVDEFYKLDPNRRDERSIVLNAAVYKLLNKSKQFFFLGPNIDSVALDDGSRWKFSFLRTRFSTVAVDTFDLRGVADKYARLHEEVSSASNWPALVFASSPDKANELSAQLVQDGFEAGSGTDLASWMRTNYGPEWFLSGVVQSGIGVHHGRIPRALASRFVALFNSGVLPVMVCTSTLIEGVNTAAKSVLIYDKKIANRSFDFFTFSNIKGRAGRLGQHHVGQVFLFNAPPAEQNVDVSAPLFGDFDDAPDEFIVHIEEEDASEKVGTRLIDISKRVGLSPDEIRAFAGISIELLESFRDQVAAAIERQADLRWRSYPSYEQIGEICNIICSVRPAREFGCRSAGQLTMYISRLRDSNRLKSFFNWHFAGSWLQAGELDNVFKFLRASEHSLPEYIALVQAFVLQTFDVNYSYLIGGLPNWFRADVLKMLEEQGVPIQISERFVSDNDTLLSISRRLRNLANVGSPRLTDFERRWVLDALPEV